MKDELTDNCREGQRYVTIRAVLKGAAAWVQKSQLAPQEKRNKNLRFTYLEAQLLKTNKTVTDM